ncbi:MAG: ABC transporter substrate-binding protein [Thermoplasmata archaeon]
MNSGIDISNDKIRKTRTGMQLLADRIIALSVTMAMLLALTQAFVANVAAISTEERILTIAMGSPIDSPNPFVGITDNAYVFFGLVYDYLMTPDENMVNQPNLALSWFPMDGPTAAASGTTFVKGEDFKIYYNETDWPYGSIWQYNLTDDAWWSDGIQFTADDVEWTIEIQIGPNFMTYWAYQPYTRWIDHVEKVDDFTVRIFFTDFDTRMPTPVAFGGNIFIPMMPKHAFEGKPASYIAQEWEGYPPIGTGLFQGTANLKNEIVSKESVTMIKNRYYNWTDENGNPHGLGVTHKRDVQIDKLIMKFFSEESTLALSIKTGDTDVGEILPGTYMTWKAQPSLPNNIILQATLSPTSYSKEVALNAYENAPGTLNVLRLDPAVQRACALATDKNYIKNNVYKGLAEIGYGLITPVTPQWYWEPDDTPSTFNVYGAQYNSSSGKYELTGVVYSYTKPIKDVMEYDIGEANRILDAAGYVWANESDMIVRKAGPLAAARLVAMGLGDYNSILNKKLIFEQVVEQVVFEDRQIGDFLVKEWEKIGVWISSDGGPTHAISLVNTATWSQLIYSYTYNTMQTYWAGDIDPNYLCYAPTSYALFGWNEFGTNSPEYDALYLKTVTTLDPTERKHWVDECQKWIYLSGSVMVTVYPIICYAMNNESWEGWGNWTQQTGMTLDAFWTENPLFWHLKYKEKAPSPAIEPLTIIVASIAVVAIVAAAVATILLRKRKRQKMLEEKETPPDANE